MKPNARNKETIALMGVGLRFKNCIAQYGSELVALTAQTWDTSVCQWMGNYWDVLVDLYAQEGLSDLVIFVRVRHSGTDYLIGIVSVYVP